MEERDLYFIALKFFLEKDGKFLVLKDGFNEWDLPGGRIRKDEFETSFEDIAKRLIEKELGQEIQYELGKPIVFMRHERIEAKEGNPTVRIFSIGYEANYISGEIHLPSHHQEMLWVDIKDFKPEDYFTGGWLKGVQDYLRLKR